jgi:alpha-mannosidase
LLSTLKSPFEVHGAPNVFLETIKRGDDDTFELHNSETTVILRLYEAYGGHAQATLKVASQVSVRKAFVTNLLEDEGDQLNILRADDTEQTAAIIKLDFRGFEVKTVKFIIGTDTACPTLQT